MHSKIRYAVSLCLIVIALLVLTTGLSLAKDGLLGRFAPKTLVRTGALTPLGTGFTYQGKLNDAGEPAEGVFDMQFELHDAGTEGTLIGALVLNDIAVTEGLFSVMLDFGSGVFDGQARWLAISMRPGDEDGAYAPLTPRQPLSAAPYALYAMEAGTVTWDNLDQNPIPGNCTADQIMAWNTTLETWECVENTDTTYSAGFGLNLAGATFKVLTDTVQTRVSGTCAPGSMVSGVNSDGTVTCEPHDTRPVFYQTALNTGGNVGHHTSIAIGADGLPIVSYYNYTDKSLDVAHCNDVACTNAITSTVDATGRIENTSITIGADGLPIISYYGIDGVYGLKVAHCIDITCTSATISTLDTTGNAGAWTSITIGVDGLPIISYYDAVDDNLKVAHCNDSACSTATLTPLDTSANDVGWWTSITIGVDGLAIISYKDDTAKDVKVAHCSNITCTSATISSPVTTGDVGDYTSITIGIDGLPIIGYRGQSGGSALTVAHCDDLVCSSATTANLYTDSSYVQGAITIGADGLPILSFRDNITERLMVAHCIDIACTSSTWVVVDDSSAQIGQYNSITVGTDGMPVISYFDKTNGNVKVTHCSNQFCVPFWRPR